MDPRTLDKSVAYALRQLTRIADALEVIALASAPKSPNYSRQIEEYGSFDWDSIGAEVLATDEYGVAQVRWGGYAWTRRAPDNKFGEAIWFSRPDGKDADGKNKFVRLITFRKAGEAEPVSRKVEKIISESAPSAAPAIESPAAGPAKIAPPPRASGARYDATKDARLRGLRRPSDALSLEGVRADVTLFWHLAKLNQLDRDLAADILRESPDPAGAIRALDQHVQKF